MSYMPYTQTSTFLFPLLDVPKSLFRCDVKTSTNRLIMTTRFINAYMWDEDLEFEFNYENYLFVVIKPYRDSNFEAFHSTVRAMPTYIDEYEKAGYIVMIFEVPEKNMEHYDLLLKGKYSELPMEAKSLILKNNYFKMNPNILPKIFNKCSSMKSSWEKALSNSHENPRLDSTVDLGDQEVWGIIVKEKEGLNEQKLINLGKTPQLSPEKEFDND